MPKDQSQKQTSRQRPVSCKFCRVRKLRCSRDSPCTNCTSRGITCELDHPIAQSETAPSSSDSEIIARLHRLEELLAERTQQQDGVVAQPESQPRRGSGHGNAHMLGNQMHGLAKDVLWLESVFVGEGFSPNGPSCQIAIRTHPVAQISNVWHYRTQSGPSAEPTRCIYLPLYAEAQVLAQKYVDDANHFHCLVYAPSVPSLLKDIYGNLQQPGQIKIGQVVLILSMFAAATHSWVAHDRERGLFPNPSVAHAQSSAWTRAAVDIFQYSIQSSVGSMEAIQGAMITSFVIGNTEGFSRSCRSLFQLAIWAARDLGLHRIDHPCNHPSNTTFTNTIQAEIGRRVWWHLCTSDWIIAAKLTSPAQGSYSCNPRHMITRKPLNIDDDDLRDNATPVEKPLSQPTDMSYVLQRVRLGEICRQLVDRTSLIMASTAEPNLSDIMDLDTEFQLLLNSMPEFFSMCPGDLIANYNLTAARAVEICHQGHTARILLYSQRCKLHLPYFTRGFTDPAYSASKELCLGAARLIVQCELDFEKSHIQPPNHFKFCGLYIGLLTSSIVLLMEYCINKNSQVRDRQRKDLVDAFRLLDEGRKESDSAAHLVDLVMQILKKHNVQPSKTFSMQHGHAKKTETIQLQTPPADGASLGGTATTAFGISTTAQTPSSRFDMVDSTCVEADWTSHNVNLTSYFDILTHDLLMDTGAENIDWENILSDLGSSFVGAT